MAQSDIKTDGIDHTDLPIGEILRRSRLQYKQTLEDVERNLRIRASQIDAIERGDFEAIPGRVYVIGFIRSYAEYLGLDGEKMVRLFKTQNTNKAAKPEYNFPVATDDIRLASPWLIAACIIGIIIIMGLWWSFQDKDRARVETIPEVTQAAPPPAPSQTIVRGEHFGPPAPTSTQSAGAAAAPPPAETPAAPSEQKSTILHIVQNSWVEIRDTSGKPLVSRVLQAGDRYFVPDRADLLMSLGNSGGVEIIVDGEKLKPLGAVGQVQRNISLDAATLKKNFGKKS